MKVFSLEFVCSCRYPPKTCMFRLIGDSKLVLGMSERVNSVCMEGVFPVYMH